MRSLLCALNATSWKQGIGRSDRGAACVPNPVASPSSAAPRALIVHFGLFQNRLYHQRLSPTRGAWKSPYTLLNTPHSFGFSAKRVRPRRSRRSSSPDDCVRRNRASASGNAAKYGWTSFNSEPSAAALGRISQALPYVWKNVFQNGEDNCCLPRTMSSWAQCTAVSTSELWTFLGTASGRDFSGSTTWADARKNPTDGDDSNGQTHYRFHFQ